MKAALLAPKEFDVAGNAKLLERIRLGDGRVLVFGPEVDAEKARGIVDRINNGTLELTLTKLGNA